MSTHVRMFKPQFAALVEAGTKRQTIRPVPKRMPVRFDKIDCRAWVGKPYRSKQRKLRLATINEVWPVTIDRTFFWLGDMILATESADQMAVMDGFKDFAEMAAWFRETHGLPFKGILITWKA